MNQLVKWNVKVLNVAHLFIPVHSFQKIHSTHMWNCAGDLYVCPCGLRLSKQPQKIFERVQKSSEKHLIFLDVSTRFTKKDTKQPKTNNQPTTTRPTSFFRKTFKIKTHGTLKNCAFFMEAGSVRRRKTHGKSLVLWLGFVDFSPYF